MKRIYIKAMLISSYKFNLDIDAIYRFRREFRMQEIVELKVLKYDFHLE